MARINYMKAIIILEKIFVADNPLIIKYKRKLSKIYKHKNIKNN